MEQPTPAQIQDLSRIVQHLSGRVHAQESIAPEPKVALPERFSGDWNFFLNFRKSCKWYSRLRPRSSGSEIQRVGWVISIIVLNSAAGPSTVGGMTLPSIASID